MSNPINESENDDCFEETCSAWQDISLGSICLILPIFTLTTTLVVIVFRHGVSPDDQGSSIFTQPISNQARDDARYVNIDSTHLMFLASRISGLATLLIGVGVVLASYPVAQRYLRDSFCRHHRLMTPYQLGLVVKFIEGSPWKALWALLQYHFDWKNHEKIWGTPLAYLTAVSVVLTLLSALVFGADTWLHFATSTSRLVKFSTVPPTSISYGFAPSIACTSVNNSVAALDQALQPCTILGNSSLPKNRIRPFADPVNVVEVLYGQSPQTSILQLPESNTSYLSPALVGIDPGIDFAATTIGVRTQCNSISQMCKLASNGTTVTYNCPSGTFAARGTTFLDQGLLMQVFKTVDFSDDEDPFQHFGVGNPFYLAAAVLGSMAPNSLLASDPAVLTLSGNRSVAVVIRCAMTVLDIEYTRVAGVVRLTSARPSNISTTNMYVSGWKNPSSFGRQNILASMNMAGIISQNAQELSDRFGAMLRNIALASGAGSISAIPVQLAQRREEILVARVPNAPLMLFIISNSAYVVLGIVLMLFAFCTRSAGREAQYHLTIAGLVANACDRANARKQASNAYHLFGEYRAVECPNKIGYNRTSLGGLVFANIIPQSNNTDIPEKQHKPERVKRHEMDLGTSLRPNEYSRNRLIDDYALYMKDSRRWI